MAAFMGLWIFFIFGLQYVHADFQVDNHDLTIIVGNQGFFNLSLTKPLTKTVNVTFEIEHKDLLRTEPTTFNVTENEKNKVWNISVLALSPGYVIIAVNVTPNNVT
ncbi:hypothetical protein PV325_009375, partial [Microctonus aethiopoides]